MVVKYVNISSWKPLEFYAREIAIFGSVEDFFQKVATLVSVKIGKIMTGAEKTLKSKDVCEMWGRGNPVLRLHLLQRGGASSMHSGRLKIIVCFFNDRINDYLFSKEKSISLFCRCRNLVIYM